MTSVVVGVGGLTILKFSLVPPPEVLLFFASAAEYPARVGHGCAGVVRAVAHMYHDTIMQAIVSATLPIKQSEEKRV